MIETRAVRRLVGLLALTLLVSMVSACHSPGGPGGPQLHASDPSNVVYRPAYPIAGTKPLYLSGYAGTYYGPGRPRRRFTGEPSPAQVASPPAMTVTQGTWGPE